MNIIKQGKVSKSINDAQLINYFDKFGLNQIISIKKQKHQIKK